MNRIFITALTALSLAGAPVFAQTVDERAKATGNDVKRGTKKGAHRVEEALCTGTKAECAAMKGKNRVEEGKDKIVDQAKETKDKVD